MSYSFTPETLRDQSIPPGKKRKKPKSGMTRRELLAGFVAGALAAAAERESSEDAPADTEYGREQRMAPPHMASPQRHPEAATRRERTEIETVREHIQEMDDTTKETTSSAPEQILHALEGDPTDPLSGPLPFVKEGKEGQKPQFEAVVEEMIQVVRKQHHYTESGLQKRVQHMKEVAGEIIKRCKEFSVPYRLALGIAALESGGNNTLVSEAGALGIFQLMPGTARLLGLKVDARVDERKNIHQNIKTGVRLIRHLLDRYPDVGLAALGFQQGGNLNTILRKHFRAQYGQLRLRTPNANELKQKKVGYMDIRELLTNKAGMGGKNYPAKVEAFARIYAEVLQHTS